jgi:hypothetical protein
MHSSAKGREGRERGGSEGKRKGGEQPIIRVRTLRKLPFGEDASQKKEVFDDDAVILWYCFRNGTAGRANVVRLRRAPAAAVVRHTDTHSKTSTAATYSVCFSLPSARRTDGAKCRCRTLRRR